MSFKPRLSMAGALEPGDTTHYEFVLVEMWDVYEVVVLNDGFFDKITILKSNPEKYYRTYRGNDTNPWTIKAALRFLNIYLEGMANDKTEIKAEPQDCLFEKFSQYYEVNEYFPDNGFDSQLDFYIHESWKRDTVVDKLRKQVENLKCCGNCINYIYDMEEDHHYCNKNIFHGKRHAGICSNNWQSDTMTREERK